MEQALLFSTNLISQDLFKKSTRLWTRHQIQKNTYVYERDPVYVFKFLTLLKGNQNDILRNYLRRIWIRISVSRFYIFLQLVNYCKITLVLVDQKTQFTAQKMKFSIKDFFSKLDQIRSFPQICSHLLEKSLLQNVGFSAMFEYSYLLPCTADQENSILGLFQEVLSFVLFTVSQVFYSMIRTLCCNNSMFSVDKRRRFSVYKTFYKQVYRSSNQS